MDVLKAAVDAATGIPSAEQRLFFGNRELRDGEGLGAEFAPDATIYVHMVKRSPHMAQILQFVLAAPPCDVRRGLRKAADEAHANIEIIFAAVSKDGLALQHAAEDLKADREIVLAAVSKNAVALRYVAEDLKADREFA